MLATFLNFVFAAAEDGSDAGKAIALGVGGGLGARLGEDREQEGKQVHRSAPLR